MYIKTNFVRGKDMNYNHFYSPYKGNIIDSAGFDR